MKTLSYRKLSHRFFLFSFFLFNYVYVSSQGGQSRTPVSLQGSVIDVSNKKPVMYANIMVYSAKDTSLLTGTISDENGNYKVDRVRGKTVFVVADFMGYERSQLLKIQIPDNTDIVNVPQIALKRSSISLGDVDVVSEVAPVEYQIDKKVINVSKDLSSSSGSAVDVLENIPSVSVDIDGNVALRGSTNFTVLLNGRPTILDASEILQQTPASEIRNIEIITNPSAKHDPEGTAGIINIITKSESREGLSGMVNGSLGTIGDYSGGVILNYAMKNITLNGGLNVRRRIGGGEYFSERRNTINDTTSIYYSDGEREFDRGMMSAKIGFDWKINEKNYINWSADGGLRNFSINTESQTKEWTEPETSRLDYFSKSETPQNADFYGTNLSFQHRIDSMKHRIDANLNWGHRWGGNESSSLESLTDENENIIGNPLVDIENNAKFENFRFQAKLDYTKQFNKDERFEAGLETNIFVRNEDYEYIENVKKDTLNPLINTTGDYDFVRNIYSTYITYAGKQFDIAYMFGVRGEYLNRSIFESQQNKKYEIERFDFFPTVHFSKELPNQNQLQLSYSRRINRPRGYQLNPIETYESAGNLRKGNPDLKPEYINSMELNWNKTFKNKSSISLENYYRNRQDIMTRYKEGIEGNAVIQTFSNINSDHSIGSELMLFINANKWLNITPSATIYYYMLESELNGNEINRSSTNWESKLLVQFSFTKSTKLQLNGSYRSPSVGLQDTREGMFVTHATFRQEFFDRKGSLSVRVFDPLRTVKYDFVSEYSNVYERTVWKSRTSFLTFSFTYTINNFKSDRKNRIPNGNGDEEEVGM